MNARILVNGGPGTKVEALDRGLQYGDGLFETIAVRGSGPRLLPFHLDRLAEGCARLGIPMPDAELLADEVRAVMPEPFGTVKIIVTRGSGARGYRPPAQARPTRIVAGFTGARPAPAATGVRARLCRTRLGRNPALAGIKHLGRLEQVLARAEWQDETIAEGLMLDDAGHVVCGTQSNLFVLRGGALVTPALDECGVRGVMRRAFADWAVRRGLPLAESRVDVSMLADADELLITNALGGARAVRELDGRELAMSGLAEEFTAWLERQA